MEATKYKERKLISISVHREIKRKLGMDAANHNMSMPKRVRMIVDAYYKSEGIQVFPESFLVGVNPCDQSSLHLNVAADVHARIKQDAVNLDIGMGDLMRNILYAFYERNIFAVPESPLEVRNRISVVLPVKTISRVHREAYTHDVNVSQFVEFLIEQHYNNNGRITPYVATQRIPKKSMSINLKVNLLSKIREDALELNTSVSAIIRNILMVHYSDDFPEIVFNPQAAESIQLSLTLPEPMIDELKNDASFGTTSVSSKINEIVGKYYERIGE